MNRLGIFYTMRAFLIFTLFIVACLLAAAALFYPAWLGVSAVAEIPPHKLLTRLAKVVAAIGLVLLLRRMQLWNRRALGYGLEKSRFIAAVARGWAAGTAIMLVPFAVLILLGARQLDTSTLTLSLVSATAAKALLAGLAVGFVEETFFRGAIYAGIRRDGGLWTAVILSSVIYAALHFVRTQPFDPSEPLGWTSGFPLLVTAFHKFGSPAIWDSFVALMAAGAFLALLRAWTGNIALAIGVHAGWVMMIKLGKRVTDPVPDSGYGFLSGTYDQVIGWLAAAWLAVLITWLARRAMAADAARKTGVPSRG
jgi:membrane protease YdiL (CAAX protease family)